MKSPTDLPADSTQDRRHALVQALRRRILTMQIAPGAVLDEYALADEFGLSRPPRVARDELAALVTPAMLSFMSESRRLANRRLKRELRVRLRWPDVDATLADAAP